MAEAPLTFVGREREMQLLSEAVANACEGAGGLWFVSGEPGMGKSRLAEEAAAVARERGMRVLWGRCWEAGGAPAYWPWIQVLRTLFRIAAPEQYDAHRATLAQILPEVATGEPPGNSGLGAEQARFQLMDAIGATLTEAAQHLPLLVLLEDLHAADESTIFLLEFLSTLVRDQSLLVLATFRPGDTATRPAGQQLIRTVQSGRHLPLERLTADDVALFAKASEATLDETQIEALQEATEGHPLFMIEVARLWRSQPPNDTEARRPLPVTVRSTIEERITKLSAPCREALERGSIVGREFDISLLRAAFGDTDEHWTSVFQEALDSDTLLDVAPQRFRFAHFLIREVVYDGIPREARASAHRRVADALRTLRVPDDEPRWSEVAHHLKAVGQDAAIEAARAYRNAGARATAQLAFGEAIQAYGQARECWEASTERAAAEENGLMIELGHAQIRAGQVRSGKQTCLEAADRARSLSDADLFAHAALEHGTALIFAQVDERLVQLLEEALEMLDDSDSVLRARVGARLAAARQPALDPEGPFALAREAIEMARSIGDPSALLDTFRNGGSAFVDLGDPSERVSLDEEHVALARKLGNRVEALRGTTRLVFDYCELAQFADAFRAIHECDQITEALGHGFYRWRSLALKATEALWRGDLDTAEPLIDRAAELGRQSGDLNVLPVHGMQRLRLSRIRGDFDGQVQVIERLESRWREWGIGGTLMNAMIGAEHLIAGRAEAGLRRYDPEAVDTAIRIGDRTLQVALSHLCIAARDRDRAEQLYDGAIRYRDTVVTGGALFNTIDVPMTATLASLAHFLGRDEDARAHYQAAIETARQTGGIPVLATVEVEYAAVLSDSSNEADIAEAVRLAEDAISIAKEIGMRAIEARARVVLEGGSSTLPAKAPVSDSVTMETTGESWLVRYGNESFHLKNTKGVRMLAQLVREPGREFHVLELAGGKETDDEVIDRGDAGEVIDEEARREYQRRATHLQEEIAEAEEWNDASRLERAREELEFLAQELARAVGLGGRERRVGGAAEKARVNVQRRIRDAIRRIEAQHPTLGKRLGKAVRTGTFCAYEPT